MNKIKNIKLAFDVVFIYIFIDTVLQIIGNYAYDHIVHAQGAYSSVDGLTSPWFKSAAVLLIVFGCISIWLKKYLYENKYLVFIIVGFLLMTQGILNISDKIGTLNFMKDFLGSNRDSTMKYKVSFIRFTIKAVMGLAFAIAGIIKGIKLNKEESK